MEIRCAGCGSTLECDPGQECWCAALPFRPMPEAPTGCLCRACLLGNRVAPEPDEEPITR